MLSDLYTKLGKLKYRILKEINIEFNGGKIAVFYGMQW